MKLRWGIVLVGMVTVGLWTATASGQHARGTDMGGMGPTGGGDHMLLPLLTKGVGLTDAQQAKVKQIVANHQAQFETLRVRLRAAHEQLADKLYASGPVKAEDLTPLVQQLAQLRGQLTQEGLQVALDIRGVLTPEQLAKAAQIRQRMTKLRAEMQSLLER